MIFFLHRRKWKGTWETVEEHCVVIHVFGDWYLVRNLLKGQKVTYRNFLWRIQWFVVNRADFLSEYNVFD
mgnify:CR=1 FL=1